MPLAILLSLLFLPLLPAEQEPHAQHWAFQPVRRPSVPRVRMTNWPRMPIDRFVLARLEEKNLAPSLEADRRTLLRRVTFDLTGLPPSPEEVASFFADPAPDAFSRVVDRLLASPHFGEKWGRHWLDVARYADTKGYVFFEEADFPWAYTYRDYVLRAWNEDLPYDRFILEQLAADRMTDNGDRWPLTGLGFLTLGGRFMNNGHDIIDDRIDVVTRGLLGLTVGCARCHDHKFDPVGLRDYYALYGIFASCAEPVVPPLFADPPRSKQYSAFANELAARERRLSEFVRAKHEELVTGARRRVAEYLLAAQSRRGQPSAEDFMLLADTTDINPTMTVRYQNYLERTARKHHPVWAIWHALADLPEPEIASKTISIVRDLLATRPLNPLVAGAFLAHPPKTIAEAARTYGQLLNAVEATDPRTASPAIKELQEVFYGVDAPANVALLPYGDLSLLPDRPSQAKLQELRRAVEQWRASGPAAPPRAMVLEDLPVAYAPRVFRRGNPGQPGDMVQRRFLEVLGGRDDQPFHQGSGRLELAQAIVHRENPLTARVFVNRVWQHLFGEGLVRTPSDFGLRSEPPSHPELLDHCAADFMESGWSIKRLIRRLVLSAAYRQRSDDRSDGRAVDPENRLLWRMNRRRLNFEETRDALLCVAGRLDRRLGGPSVRNFVAPTATRRTLYGYLDRLNVPGLYRTFDFPSPDATSPQRDATTVPPQALFLMNHPFSQECARRLAQRHETAGSSLKERIKTLYEIVYGRNPSDEERSLAAEFLVEGEGLAERWVRYAHALLMTNEFLFVD